MSLEPSDLPAVPSFFRFPYTIGLHDTDAAGLIFSPNIFRVCHQAYEAMLAQIGFSMAVLFQRRTMSLPVVHLETDFRRPLRLGMEVTVVLRVAHFGRTSYRVGYEVFDESGECCASAASVHVCVDPKTHQPIEIPEPFRLALEKFA